MYGMATLTNTNLYSNQAQLVVLAFSTVLELSSIAPLVYAHCWRCVVAGHCEFLCLIEPTHVTFHCSSIAPMKLVTLLSRLAGRWRLCQFQRSGEL